MEIMDEPQTKTDQPVGGPIPVTSNLRQASTGNYLPKVRDKWDKADILLRPTATLLTAFIVATIGFCGERTLYTQATEQTKRTEILEREITLRTQNSDDFRLYTQLLSQREESESALRKDIFQSILEKFLDVPATGIGHTNIRNRLLKLEILALNFGDALSVSPLFAELDRNIREATYDTESAQLSDRKRLESLSKRVSQRQISALSAGGKSWNFEIPIDKIGDDETFEWPTDVGQGDSTQKPYLTTFEDILGDDNFRFFESPKDDPPQESYQATLGNTTREYILRFNNVDRKHHSVDVDIEIRTVGETKSVEQKFTLNFFNFPMVDNTRLSEEQRFALIMNKFEAKAIHFSAIVFPGMYSSQRDKPFIDDVIHQLRASKITGRREKM